MPDIDFHELEVNILRRLRLAAADPASVTIDKRAVELAFAQCLAALELSPRPVSWARDGQHAQALIAGSLQTSAKEELRRNMQLVADALPEREKGSWVASRDTAVTAGGGDVLQVVKRLVGGYIVQLSIPWRSYHGGAPRERGARMSPADSVTWQTVGDALEYAARTAAECTRARVVGRPETHVSLEEFCLPLVAAFDSGVWLFWITPSEVVALPRPTLKLQAKQLHCEDSPAVSWPAGEEEFFFLNGVPVPGEIVETPARELDPRLILQVRNAEVRREIVRKIGIERVCDALEAQCLDRSGNYELLLLDLQDGRTRPFLKMKNPSVGVYHIEGVAPECRTVAEALAWRNQSDVPPSILT